ncbi:MAG: peptide ABC transporter substrate-binding protein [SAR86 cluster bacterium BACL1 MAG-120619-bin26]|nr:MAG: peptide ABC transporter substrate-binding protein [SAR86 cluster bacterium BACL1 MAG-120619-bin26]
MKNIYLYCCIVALIVSCSKSTTPVDSDLDLQILHVGNGSEPQGLDPHVVTGVPEHNLLIALCEGLTIANPKGGESLPGVAKSWTISPDGKTYTFLLQDNLLWSNGDTLTASDFVWSWKRILTPSLGSQYSDMLYYVKGAADYHQGLTDDFSTVGVTAVNDRELRVELTYATPFFIKLLSHYSTYPVHQETVLKHGTIDDRNGQWTRPGNFVCNGPMNLNAWELNKEITVKKNPLYWDADSVRLNEIRYYPVSNESTEDRMFRAGQLHVTNVVPLEKCPVYIENNNPDLRIEPYMGTYFYRVNTKHPVLKDKRVRLALAYALNRQQIVDRVSKCGQLAAYSFTPPGTAGYEPNTSIEFNPELAKSLLAEAGYADPSSFPVLEILFNTQEGHRKIALAVQQMWQQNLGISVQLVNQDWKVYLAREMIGDFQISRAGWIGDYEDPNTFLDTLRPNRGNNKTGWDNQEYDDLLAMANSTNDQELRYDYLNQAEMLLISEMPIIPIYTYVKAYQISSDVKGWDANLSDTHHPKFVYLER